MEDAGATLVGQIIGDELNAVGIFDGDLLIRIKGQKQPLKLNKDDAQALKAIII